MVKAPRAGEVKTRLAAAIGSDRAVAIYRAMGERIVAAIRPVADVTIWYDPPDARREVTAWLGDATYLAQPGGDLGARLAAVFRYQQDHGPRTRAVAIGADAPEIDGSTLQAAERVLREVDVVLGPALDGGYYLIGMSSPHPELFRDIPWSTGDVAARTLDRCKALRLTVRQLPPLRDVDTVDDARALGLLTG